MENSTQGLTLETLPKAFASLLSEVGEIKRLLLEKSSEQPPAPDRWMDLPELCNYHPDKPSRATVYFWCHNGLAPFHKGAKKLRFLKSEIDHWLTQGKKKTLAEIATESNLHTKKKGGYNV